MPAPGYSRERPHCFVLTLPNGGSYFFQAGTPDLVAEWVATCNYWSARLSKEPLSGGVSNMEYGWNRAEPVSPNPNEDDDYEEIASIRSGHSRVSRAESSFSYNSGTGSTYGNSDRIHINDWKPPQVPLTPSNLPEEVQLDALRRHGNIVKKELAQHTALRPAMIRLVRPPSVRFPAQSPGPN
jgi:PH/SEC7 domain-containing protein